MGVARDERRLLCDLFEDLGPDQPTLCAGWTTRDLAAHLVLRERRLDAAPGILLRALAGRTERVQAELAARPWPELVGLVRGGPPALSPSAISAVDEAVNTAEFFVHHEDVRRAQPDWEPRSPDPVRDDAVWRALGRAARLTYRRSPVGVVLRRPDGREITARRGPDQVVITGRPGELLLHAFGREQCRIDLDGEQRSIAVVTGLSRGL